MTRKIAILDDYQRVALTSADWNPVKTRVKTIDVFTDTLSDEDALVKRLESYEIICAMRERTKFTAGLLDRLPQLKLIATTGPRNAGIDVAHASKKGIVVSGTGGGGNSTIEHIWTLILSTARHICAENDSIKANNPQWQTKIPRGLSGRTLGLVGVGRLGAQVAAIAKAFNMRVIGWSPNLTKERAEAAGVEFCPSKAELFSTADVVSIHLVLSPTTHHIITAADLALLRRNSIFINTSRGPLVDEAALVQALANRADELLAGLDVYEVEPLPLSHPLRQLRNVTLSPHNGYVNDSNYEVFWADTVDNVLGFLDGKPKRVMQAP